MYPEQKTGTPKEVGTMKWFEMWIEDKNSIIATMYKNMVADIEAGYDPMGYCIKKQRAEIEAYQNEFDDQIDKFKEMDDAKVNRWCYYDMKKRGAI